MKTPIRTEYIKTLPSAHYKLAADVEVQIFQEPGGVLRASAPDLGMWVDGFGRTEQEAIDQLSNAILGQRESLAELEDSDCLEYAKAIKRNFEHWIVEV